MGAIFNIIQQIPIILGKEGCKGCNEAKEYFEKYKIPFLYVNFKDADQRLKWYIVKTLKDLGMEVTYPIIIYPISTSPEQEHRDTIPFAPHNNMLFCGFSEKLIEQMDKIRFALLQSN